MDRHYYDWLSDWLGITAYVPAISGWEMKHVETEVRMFQETAPGVQPDMICIFLGTNDYNAGIPIGEWYTEAVEEVEAAVGEPKRVFQRLHRTFVYDEGFFKGRINRAVRLLKETFPGTPITFLTPVHRALFDAGDRNYQPEETWQNRIGLYLDAYIDAIKASTCTPFPGCIPSWTRMPPYSTRIRTRTGSTRTKPATGAWRKSSSISPSSSPAG